MSKDIRMEDSGKKFKFRVGGIVENKEKVLVVKMNKNDFYCFPGGHVEMYEDTKTALARELKEELSFDVEIDNLAVVSENFYFLRDSNFHELCFYYYAHCKNREIDMKDEIIEEEDKFGKVIHRFKWLDKKDLLKEDVRPKEIAEYIIKNKQLSHFITIE